MGITGKQRRVAVAGVEPHARGVAPQDAEAVVLDLVEPVRAARGGLWLATADRVRQARLRGGYAVA
jgi:hypothetical protein